MGGAPSRTVGVFPVYYVEGITDQVTSEDIDFAVENWRSLQDDTSAAWLARKSAQLLGVSDEEGGDGEGKTESCLVWFMDSFYMRLFDVSPSSKALFHNKMRAQGKALVGLLAVAVSVLREPEKLIPALEDLAKRHAKYGVVASQYGTVGEVLLWSLELVLGTDFTAAHKHAWLKIYCLMLKYIIPVAVEEERRILQKPSEDEHNVVTVRRAGVEKMLEAAGSVRTSTEENPTGAELPTASSSAATTTGDAAAAV